MKAPEATLACLGAITAALTLGLSATAGAATAHLVPLDAATFAPSHTCLTAATQASIADLAAPVLPAIAEGQRVGGVTTMHIDLDAAGRLMRADVLGIRGRIVRSGG